MEKKANHRANIVRLGEPRLHTNAERLELWDIEGYQVVSQKGQFKANELAVYIQPDSVVPQIEAFRFIWGPYVAQEGNAPETLTQERRRRITVRKFRGEWSEGLLMPISDFSGGLQHEPKMCYGWLKEGDDVSELLGITHWDPQDDKAQSNEHAPRRKYPKTLRGWFWFILYSLGLFRARARKNSALNTGFNFPVYDVENFKNFRSVLRPGEYVHVTEKIHGANARFVFVEGTMYAGSRNNWWPRGEGPWWKAVEQRPEIEEWCIANEGYVLYGEVAPQQKGFDYGLDEGSIGFFAFDVRDPDGNWVWPGNLGFPLLVPSLGNFEFSEDLLKLADGKSLVPGAKHIREGIVIRAQENRHVRGLGRVHLKVVSNAFLEKDSKEK